MKCAKSMYLGGSYITAEQSNYDTCRVYGLVCPACHSAVFFRASAKRLNTLRNGVKRWQYVNPCFVHYHTGIEDVDCELRSPHSFSEEVMRLAEIEAHNQRLKLYNKHLISMFRDDHDVSPSLFKQKGWRSVFTKTCLERIAQKIRHIVQTDPKVKENLLYKELLLDYTTCPESQHGELLGKIENYFNSDLQPHNIAKFSNMWMDYLQRHDLELHHKIAVEILEFLLTKSGGYALVFFIEFGAFFGCSKLNLSPQGFRIVAEPELYLYSGLIWLYRTRWLDVIPKYLEQYGEAQDCAKLDWSMIRSGDGDTSNLYGKK